MKLATTINMRVQRPAQFFNAFRTCILLTAMCLGSTYPTCDEVTKGLWTDRTINSCACANKTSDFFYYHCDAQEESCFRCLNSNVTISKEAVCDNVADCPDLTDELLCPTKYKDLDQVNSKRVLHCGLHGGENQQHNETECFCRIPALQETGLHCDENATATFDGIETEQNHSSRSRCWCFYLLCSVDENSDPIRWECYSDAPVSAQNYNHTKEYIALVVTGFAIGILAVLGNACVIFTTTRDLHRKRTRFTQEEKLTKYFFLSLSISDMIVGINTVLLCSLLQDIKVNRPGILQIRFWLTPCDVANALIMLGTEQSVFTMILITTSRLWGIIRPFSRVPVKPFLLLLLFSWILSISIAVIPVMTIFEELFLKELLQEDVPFLKRVGILHVDNLNRILRTNSKRIEYAGPNGSWAELRYFLDKLFNIKETYNVGFYHGINSCLPHLFPRVHETSMGYNVMIYTLNFLFFLYMVFGYTYIYTKHTGSKTQRDVAPAEIEAQKLKRKIFLILATDFLCWIPLCIIFFSNIIYSAMSDGCEDDDLPSFGYLAASLVGMLLVLPINSLVNPFLYSAAPDYLHRKLMTSVIMKKVRCIQDYVVNRRKDKTSTVQTIDTGILNRCMTSNVEKGQHQDSCTDRNNSVLPVKTLVVE